MADTLHYRQGRMFWLVLGAVALTFGSFWLAIRHPVPHGFGRYAALYAVTGPTGITLLFGFSAVFFTFGGLIAAANLLSDGVAAEIRADGLSVRRWFGRVDLPWREIHGFDRKCVVVRGRETIYTHVHHEPRAFGPLTFRKVSILHNSVDGDVEQWVASAEAGLSRSRSRPVPSAGVTPPSKGGFGRRGLDR